MIASVQQIKYELLAYMKELGGTFGDYVVGIAGDPREVLSKIHHVNLQVDPWIYKQALSFSAARTVRTYFVEKLNVDGAPEGSTSDDTDCVYLYRKSVGTRP